MGFELDPSYKQVPERIADFKAKHPEGSLQSEIVELPGPLVTNGIAVKAYAYRTPDDVRPGIGYAYEPVPGRTPYTKDSELQNAETSAWGRAIVAALASESKAIASAEDVRNRAADEDARQYDPTPQPDPVEEELKAFMASVADLDEDTRQTMNAWWKARDPSTSVAELLGAGRAVLAQALADSMRGVDDEKPPDPEITVTPEQVAERTAAGVCVGCGKPFSKSGKHVQDVGDPLYAACCAPF